MMIENTRFGIIEYDPEKVVEFGQGLIGFSDQKRYLLLEHKPGSPIHWLQSLEVPQLAFPLVNPDLFVKDYVVQPPENLEELVGGFRPEDLWLGVIMSPGSDRQVPALNLKAPVIINTATHRAVQLVLEQDLPVHIEIGPGHERPE